MVHIFQNQDNCMAAVILIYMALFHAKQNDVIKNFAVAMSAVIKRVDCIWEVWELHFQHAEIEI